jgi:hypothetical protein
LEVPEKQMHAQREQGTAAGVAAHAESGKQTFDSFETRVDFRQVGE